MTAHHPFRELASVRKALVSLLVLTLTISACSKPDEHASANDEHGHAHGEESGEAEFERGPHQGRMLRDGDFALELKIVEQGAAPEFHVWLYRSERVLPVAQTKVSVELTRLGGQVDRFTFTPREDYLLGQGAVHEPHSFSVKVEASESGNTHRWAFDSFEGRTTITAKIAQESGVVSEMAGPAAIAESITLTGRIVPNAEHVRSVSARFPGPIREIVKSIGDPVNKGDRLATVESDDSLQRYAITAPISGVVIERHANPGEHAGDQPLFVVADHSRLWAELSLFPRDLSRVKVGQKVTLKTVDGGHETGGEGGGEIVRIAPAEGASHGSLSGVYTARVALDNIGHRWIPGLFVQGRVEIGSSPVALAVKRSGLQGFRESTVVFAQVGDTYEVRMLELGRQDETWVEVLSGLAPGERYVSVNSYLIKADIEKSGASHEH